MLKEQYEKHNLEMQPYRHYLAEYQAMQPEYISSHLELPFDGFGRSFRVRFMEREYSVSHPDFFIRCLDGEEGIAVLCRDIHAKILLLRYLTEGDRMQATGNLLSYRDLPWGEVYTANSTDDVFCGWPGPLEIGWRNSGGSWKG